MRRAPLTLAQLVDGVLAGERSILARAITLVESQRADHRELAGQLVEAILPHSGQSHRIGITGVPGVGKSTFIEGFGRMLTARGQRVAVLAIDPSSSRSHGSILGDKTRMQELARDPLAFIRPSPAGSTLGGVAAKTRESMLLCEAAGFDVILVETVGVGQSETVVHDMVDFFLVLMLSGAGDELQGIKRGVLEMADCIAVNKADGDNADRAKKARLDYANALRVMQHHGPWTPTAHTCSGLSGMGLPELWKLIADHRACLEQAGLWQAQRATQQQRWMWNLIEDQLLAGFHGHSGVRAALTAIEAEVRSGQLSATGAARQLLAVYREAAG